MADTKVSDMTALTGANTAADDLLPIIDVSETGAAKNKSITSDQLRVAVLGATAALTPAATVDIDFTGAPVQTLALDQTTTLTTSNLAAGRSVKVRFTAVADRVVNTPVGWTFLSPALVNVSAGQTIELALFSAGAADASVIAAVIGNQTLTSAQQATERDSIGLGLSMVSTNAVTTVAADAGEEISGGSITLDQAGLYFIEGSAVVERGDGSSGQTYIGLNTFVLLSDGYLSLSCGPYGMATQTVNDAANVALVENVFADGLIQTVKVEGWIDVPAATTIKWYVFTTTWNAADAVTIRKGSVLKASLTS